MPHPAVFTDHPLVFAHRGGAALAPENTLAAFDRGLALDADGLEMDVRLSRDGIAVVHHDADLDRTTDHTGPVAARTAEELARVDAGARFESPDGFVFRGRGLGVPSLADVLARYQRTRIIIELKEDTEALARAVVDDIERAGAGTRVCVGSFGSRAMAAVRRLAPDLATSAALDEVRAALHRSRARRPAVRPPYQAFQVPERSERLIIVTPRFVADAARAGVVVQVWTVDDPSDMRRLLGWGVMGIITDRPDVAVSVVRESMGHEARP
jgi:glycerophosphoryl diester phosphodiesterase